MNSEQWKCEQTECEPLQTPLKSPLISCMLSVFSCFLARPTVLSQCICTYAPSFLSSLGSAFRLADAYLVFRPHMSHYFLIVPFLAFFTRLNSPSTLVLNMTYLSFVAFTTIKSLHVNAR